MRPKPTVKGLVEGFYKDLIVEVIENINEDLNSLVDGGGYNQNLDINSAEDVEKAISQVLSQALRDLPGTIQEVSHDMIKNDTFVDVINRTPNVEELVKTLEETDFSEYASDAAMDALSILVSFMKIAINNKK